MTQSINHLDSAFELIQLDGGVDVVFAPASPTAAHPSLPDASSAIAASATVAPVDVTMASVDLAAGQTTDAPAAVASAVVDPAAAPAVVVTPADAAPTAAAPAAAVPAPRFSCKDPLERRAGIPLGVIPSGDLVYSADTIVDDASKYYAITRGRFIGVFAKSSEYVRATSRVLGPISWCPDTLGEALDWFNESRAMGLCEIVG
ncbi:hypothetical protein GGG16DRAFT_119014 [Schizophyllum commune]